VRKLILISSSIFTGEKRIRDGGIVIEGDKVTFVGSREEALGKARRGDIVVDLNGYTVLPGFQDAHLHLLGLSLSDRILDLRDVDSIDVLKEKVAEQAEKLGPGKWIVGRGWDQEKFIEKRYPTRRDLDDAAPRNPVLLTRVCGHIAVANTLALKIAGVWGGSAVKETGVEFDENGDPTGVLKENAVELVAKAVPEPSLSELAEILKKGIDRLLAAGLTTIHAMSVTEKEFKALQLLRSKGQLKIKVRVYFDLEAWKRLKDTDLLVSPEDDFIRVMGVKVFADGSLGGRTAALQEPYSDKPDVKGDLLMPKKELSDLFKQALKHGFQVAVHAIGDRAIKEVLEAARASGIRGDLLRIEHVSVVTPTIIEDIRDVSPYLIVQPHFILSDWWIVRRLGEERSRFAYAFKSLLAARGILAASSDAPVEPFNPWLGVYAAVLRGEKEKIELYNFTRGEKLSIDEAIKMYTVYPAIVSKDQTGLISEGRKADIIVVDGNPFEASGEELPKIRVLMTIVNGEIVYNALENHSFIKYM